MKKFELFAVLDSEKIEFSPMPSCRIEIHQLLEYRVGDDYDRRVLLEIDYSVEISQGVFNLNLLNYSVLFCKYERYRRVDIKKEAIINELTKHGRWLVLNTGRPIKKTKIYH